MNDEIVINIFDVDGYFAMKYKIKKPWGAIRFLPLLIEPVSLKTLRDFNSELELLHYHAIRMYKKVPNLVIQIKYPQDFKILTDDMTAEEQLNMAIGEAVTHGFFGDDAKDEMLLSQLSRMSLKNHKTK